MRILEFAVDGQKLSKKGDFSSIVRGTKGYLKCDFDLSAIDWSGYKVVAVFERRNKEFCVPVINGSCNVPDEVTDGSYFKIRIVGAKDTIRITTNKVLVSQEG